ncbi:hypothetical protein ES708_13153 [subsurface metagenome]
MRNFDVLTEETAYGINIRVMPAKTKEYGYPPGFKHRLTIQAGNRDQAVNAVRFALSAALKPSQFKE